MFEFLKRLLPKKEVIVEIPLRPVALPEPPAEGRELPLSGDAAVLKLGVIVGHDKNAQGARMCSPHNLTEYAYCSEIARGMKDRAPANINVEIIYRDGVGIIGAYNLARHLLCDAVVELHFDAFNGKARGSTTLCSPDREDREFANHIHASISKMLQRGKNEDRGVKAISQAARGGVNVHSFPSGVNCLLEPFFGDNPEDAQLGMDKKVHIAKAILDGVGMWGCSIGLIRGR